MEKNENFPIPPISDGRSDFPTRKVSEEMEVEWIELEDYFLYLFEDIASIEVYDKERGILVESYVVNPLKKKLMQIAEKVSDVGVHQIFFQLNNRFNTYVSIDIFYNAGIKGSGISFRYSVGLDEKGKVVAKESEYEVEHSDPEVNKLLKEVVEDIIKPQLDKTIEHISNIVQKHNLKMVINLANKGLGVTSTELFWFDEGSLQFLQGVYISPDEVDEVYQKLQERLSPNQQVRYYKHKYIL